MSPLQCVTELLKQVLTLIFNFMSIGEVCSFEAVLDIRQHLILILDIRPCIRLVKNAIKLGCDPKCFLTQGFE